MSVTPNMNLTLPDVSVTPGPTYASQVNAAMGVVDGHDHTPGFGVKVPSAGININADLPFGGFNATGLLTTAYTSQSADPSGNTRIYFKGGEMYATDGSGNHVQITSGGNVNVGSVGAITGMGGTSATVSYSNATKVFTFNQAANQTALIKAGDLQITDSSVTSGAAVTVKSPAGLATGYTVTFPGALPASTSPLTISNTGTLATGDITDESTLTQSSGILSVKNAGVTRAKLAAVGEQTTSSSGAFSTTSTTAVDVTNLSVTLTTTGRPVMVLFRPAGTGGSAGYISVLDGGGANTAHFVVNVDGAGFTEYELTNVSTTVTNVTPPGCLNTLVTGLSAASHTIKLQAFSQTGTATTRAQNVVMVAYEL